jgi:hypothetical protein
MTPCSPLSVNRCFGGTYRLHLQGRRNKFSKKPASKQVASKRYVPPKRQLTLNRLHGVICQKMIFFITTTVKTSIPTLFNYTRNKLFPSISDRFTQLSLPSILPSYTMAVPYLRLLVAGFPPRQPGFAPRSGHATFVAVKGELGQSSSKYFGFLSQF